MHTKAQVLTILLLSILCVCLCCCWFLNTLSFVHRALYHRIASHHIASHCTALQCTINDKNAKTRDTYSFSRWLTKRTCSNMKRTRAQALEIHYTNFILDVAVSRKLNKIKKKARQKNNKTENERKNTHKIRKNNQSLGKTIYF